MIAVVKVGADYMLSLRQVESADVSELHADPHARSKEWRSNNSFSQNAHRISTLLRKLVALIGFSLVMFGTQVAIAQLLGACVLYMPTHRFFAVNTLLLLVPGFLYFICRLFKEAGPSIKSQLLVAGLTQALAVAVSSLALRLNCQSIQVIAPSLVVLAIGNAAFVKGLIEMVTRAVDVKTYSMFNTLLCAGGVLFSLAAVYSVKVIGLSMPSGLEIAASFILLGSVLFAKTSLDGRGTETLAPPQLKPIEASTIQHLLPFVVAPAMTALPVFTVLLLTLERNWVLFPQLLHMLVMISAGVFSGIALSVWPAFKRFQLSQHAMPALATLALAFVLAITPGENQGSNCDCSLVILGALFVFCNVQLLTRAQEIFSHALLDRSVNLALACATFGVGLAACLIEPFLDTISATMLTRFLGLEIVVSGSVTLSAILLWQNRLGVVSQNRGECKAILDAVESSPDYRGLSVASGHPTE